MDLFKWLERNKVIVLVGILLAIFLATGFLYKPPSIEGRESAIDFAVKDASQAYPNASVSVINAVQEGDKWKVDVKIALDAHSACPTVYVRKYDLLPIFFREEQRIKNCVVSGTVVFEEEAVAASAKTGLAAIAASAGAPGYATRYESEILDQLQSCPECPTTIPEQVRLEVQGLSSQNVWVVEWKATTGSVFVVLSEKGEVLAEKAP